jgi:hypothetical protein
VQLSSAHDWDDATKEAVLRFYKYVDILPNGCWFWTGARSRGKGNRKWYGSFKFKGKSIRAHRFACDVIGGKVCPPGWHRDHTCKFSLCVCPDHIEPVTHQVNQERKMERISPASSLCWVNPAPDAAAPASLNCGTFILSR